MPKFFACSLLNKIFLGRHLLDELDAPVLVHIPLGIHESGIAVVVLIEHLKLTSVYYISLYIFHTMFA